MIIPIIILFIVFVLIAIRQIGNIKLQIWQIMLFGGVAVLITGQISPISALKSINFDVILFLFGMFIIGSALEGSGYLSLLSYKLFKRAKTFDYLLLFLLFGVGFASAVLMNDTLAIIGVPVVLLLAKKHSFSPKILLLALCFAVTIGSVMSPIGNPQNLLIALNGNIKNPFMIFFKYLFIPTIINIFLTFLIIKLFYKDHFHKGKLNHSQERVKDHKLAVLSKASLILIFILILIKIILIYIYPDFDFRLTYIALISALPIILFSNKRVKMIKHVDWPTLVFFVAMFILMQAVWNSGFFQEYLLNSDINILSIPMVFIVSIILSQFISNVPLVALYLPVLQSAGASSVQIIALAAASTIAGNLLILGAASNVIVIQNAEKRTNGKETISFLEFAKIGIPLTVINSLVYVGYFYIIGLLG